MRARYYNTDIRRFINQDIITGSIGNSQSLNRYAYVQGNPVSYTDPFGLSPLNAMADAVGHAVLDLIGSIPVFGAPANILNCYWYCKEGNREMAVMSGIAILPGVGQFIGAGAKALKLTRTSQYIITATKFAGSMANCMIAVGTCIETGKRIYHDIRNGKFGLNVNTIANIATIGLSVFAAAVSGKEMAGAGVELANMVAEDLHEFGVKVDTLLSRLRLNDKGFTYLYRAKNNGNGIEGGRKTDFYVTPSGEAVPATGYRYMDSKYAEQTMSSMSAPGSYFGFEKFDSASAAQDAFQISPEWSDCRLRGEFDTLQVIDDMYVPKAYGDKGPGLEPFTRCYPEYGKGGAQQYIFKGTIKFKNVKLIGD